VLVCNQERSGLSAYQRYPRCTYQIVKVLILVSSFHLPERTTSITNDTAGASSFASAGASFAGHSYLTVTFRKGFRITRSITSRQLLLSGIRHYSGEGGEGRTLKESTTSLLVVAKHYIILIACRSVTCCESVS